mgnify:CR=1 FL=1
MSIIIWSIIFAGLFLLAFVATRMASQNKEEEGLRDMRLIEAILESHRAERWVHLDA